jgi:hypothetical protein
VDGSLKPIRGRILADRESGATRTLAEYGELFPGEDVLVALAYADVFGADLASPKSSDPDSVGHYRIVKELGRGGQGIVYLAEDTRLHRKVALKVLTGLGPGSEDSVQRFRREAEVASKLKHPGICGVHDAGIANGTPYGLVAGVWTRDGSRALRVARKLRCGQVFINNYGAGGGVELPFGGVKHSGHGREKGFEALYGFSSLKTVAIHHG